MYLELNILIVSLIIVLITYKFYLMLDRDFPLRVLHKL